MQVALLLILASIVLCTLGSILYYYHSSKKTHYKKAVPFRDLTEKEKQILEDAHNKYTLTLDEVLHPFFKTDLTKQVVRLEKGRVHKGLIGKGFPPQLFRINFKRYDSRLHDRYGWTSDFLIEGYEFNKYLVLDNYKSVTESLNDGDIVTVEFSPNSGYIWKIEKTS